MAQLGTTIDPNAIEPSQFDDLPVGEYAAQIIESEVVATKAGNGKLLKLTWQVVEGQFENRKFWQQINYEHASAQAQTIGQQQLKAICDAVGHTDHLSDSEVLHFVPCRVKLSMGKANGNYAARPEVKGVKPYGVAVPAGKPATTGAAPQQRAAAPQQAAKPAAGKPAAAPTGSRPWANKATTAA